MPEGLTKHSGISEKTANIFVKQSKRIRKASSDGSPASALSQLARPRTMTDEIDVEKLKAYAKLVSARSRAMNSPP